jgi:hypothetical protein
MRKCLLPYLIIIAFLFGCAAFKIPVQKVEGNTFYCSSPRLEVEVSKELKFVGEKKQRNNKAPGYFKYFLFRGTSNQLAISVAKARSEWTFSNPSVGRRCGDNLYCGKLRLGGHNYQYTTSTEGPYIKRTYFRNTHNNTAKIVIMIWGKRDTELASEREQLILFDKNCKAAFTIKSEKVASLSKEERHGGHWIGEAKHTTAYGEAGVVCRDASINFDIMEGRINGRAVDDKGKEYELRGTVSEEGGVSAGMAVGEHTLVSFSGELAEESGMGSWETIRRCSGTWNVRRQLE